MLHLKSYKLRELMAKLTFEAKLNKKKNLNSLPLILFSVH